MIAALFATAAAAMASTPFAPSARQQAAVEQAAKTGRDLYEFDRAAWVATNSLLQAVRDPGAAGIRGWIVEREGRDLVTTFYSMTDAVARKIYVVRTRDGEVATAIRHDANDAGVTARAQRMIAAREAVLNPATFAGRPLTSCGKGPINSVVLEPAGDTAPVPVYLLTPQQTATTYSFGGHHRLDVDAKGAIVSERSFAKSCLTLDTNAQPNVTAYVLSHLMDPQPTEIHVMQSLASRTPLMVVIAESSQVWQVSGDTIKPVGIAKLQQ